MSYIDSKESQEQENYPQTDEAGGSRDLPLPPSLSTTPLALWAPPSNLPEDTHHAQRKPPKMDLGNSESVLSAVSTPFLLQLEKQVVR